MSALEMTMLCAEAMGYEMADIQIAMDEGSILLKEFFTNGSRLYRPISDDAQAMALVKKFKLSVLFAEGDDWQVCHLFRKDGDAPEIFAVGLNRAIVECVAKMQQAAKP